MHSLLFCSVVVSCWALISTDTATPTQNGVVYAAVGQDVVLDPGVSSEPGSIKFILWKYEKDLAMEWDNQSAEVTAYSHFKERGHLNLKNGQMTIKQLIHSDSGEYTPEIENMVRTPVRLIVLSPVPKPTVAHSCDGEKTTCTLTCGGNSADAGTVSSIWVTDGKTLEHSTSELNISKMDEECFNVVTCTLKNQVSNETSESYTNPLTSCAKGNPRIYTAVMVSVGLLAAVIVFAASHRWMTGEWFWEKDDMPWEAGFYRRSDQPAQAANQNGVSHGREEGKTLVREDDQQGNTATSAV